METIKYYAIKTSPVWLFILWFGVGVLVNHYEFNFVKWTELSKELILATGFGIAFTALAYSSRYCVCDDDCYKSYSCRENKCIETYKV